MTCIEDLPLRIRVGLEKSGLLSSSSILLTSESELCKLTNLSKEDCKRLKNAASNNILTCRFVTVLDASTTPSWKYVSVGCKVLDSFLRGGVAIRGITEIAGESSSGKTQLCMQMTMSIQYPSTYGGLSSGAVYICTEDAFPSRRLQQLFHTFPPTFQNNPQENKIQFGDNIFIEHIADVNCLKQCIIGRLPPMLSQRNIGIIIIDSIAGVFRADYEASDAVNRAQDLRIIGGQLHKLAKQFNLAVICVNQVSSVINETGGGDGSKSQNVASLGLSWANLVTTRIQLHRTCHTVQHPNESIALPVRTMEVIFSPHLPQQRCSFIISSSGVSGLK